MLKSAGFAILSDSIVAIGAKRAPKEFSGIAALESETLLVRR
ncbi:hypothetical protein [Paenibacillus sp. FSL R10-2778]